MEQAKQEQQLVRAQQPHSLTNLHPHHPMIADACDEIHKQNNADIGRQAGELEMHFSAVFKEFELLSQVTETVIQHLEPVLSPDTIEVDEKPDPCMESHSILTHRLADILDQIKTHRLRLADLNRRLVM